MINIWVFSVSAVLEPSTAGCATTELTGFLHGATLGANGTDWLRHGQRRGFCFAHGRSRGLDRLGGYYRTLTTRTSPPRRSARECDGSSCGQLSNTFAGFWTSSDSLIS